jgi:2-iminobutanoate/2-iminopropanoate deaminase
VRTIRTESAPAPVAGAPYSQGVAVAGGELLFISGQVAIDPATGAIAETGVAAQTSRAMANLLAVLSAAGGAPGDLVKTTIYMTHLSGFAEMNGAYAAALGGHAPARATVGVAALPLGALVEIEGVAVIGRQ